MRIMLTGTPIQNNMDELFTLLSFVAPQEFECGQLKAIYHDHLQRKDISEGCMLLRV
jgi:SNF2 family DNA or RNA helicase